MKICFVTEDFYPNFIGGQGIYGFQLITRLAKQRHQIWVLAEKRRGRSVFWEKIKKVSLIQVPFSYGNQLLLAFWEYVYFINKLTKVHFDILHANQLSGLFFVLFKPKNVKKIVVSVHNTNYDMFQVEQSKLKRFLYRPLIFLERLLYRRADALLFNSPDEEKDLRHYYDLKNKPTRSVYLGSQKVKFSLKQQRNARKMIHKKLGLSDDAKIVLYVGRIVKRKRVKTLIEAMNIKFNDRIWSIIIGEGPEKKNLEKIAAPKVKFLRFVENTRPYFLAADVFVLTSVAEGGIALSTLEAASYGLPLILSPSPAGNPILEPGKNGYIVSPNNPKQLAKKIQLAINNYKSMSKQSLKKARFFTWEKTAKETIKFYLSLLEKA